MKLKDVIKYMVGVCTVEVEDATNEDFNHVEDFMSNNADKMELYQNAQITSIMPHSKDCIQINVCINYQ